MSLLKLGWLLKDSEESRPRALSATLSRAGLAGGHEREARGVQRLRMIPRYICMRKSRGPLVSARLWARSREIDL